MSEKLSERLAEMLADVEDHFGFSDNKRLGAFTLDHRDAILSALRAAETSDATKEAAEAAADRIRNRKDGFPDVRALARDLVAAGESEYGDDATNAAEAMREAIERHAKAGQKLAEYVSYAEIVGGISVNRPAIRWWCDEVFKANRDVQDAEDALRAERNDLRVSVTEFTAILNRQSDELAALKAQIHGAVTLHAALRAENEVLRKALECILPYLPKSTAKDGGPNAFSGHVKAADTVRAALSTKEPT